MNPLRLLLGLVLLFLLPGVGIAFWRLGGELLRHRDLPLPLAAGAVAGIAIAHLVLRRFHVVAIFEHELTHALAGLVFLRPIRRFVVTRRRGGLVTHGGGFGGAIGDDFIGLAPYVLPTFTVAAVLVRPLLVPPHLTVWAALVGLTFGFHLWTTLDELRRNWTGEVFAAADGNAARTDIAERGFVYSAVYIVTVTLAIHGLLLGLVVRGWPGASAWAGHLWPATEATGRWLLALAGAGLDAAGIR